MSTSGKSDYLELKLLDHVFGGPDYARPATLYIGLFSSAPDDSGGGTEITGGSYPRAAVTNNSTNFPAAAGGGKSNGTVIPFATAGAPLGNATHFGVFDALTGGNLLYWGPLTTPRTITTGDAPSIAVGQIQFTED